MKVKTLVNAMRYEADEAELVTDNMDLISKMAMDTLIICYGDCKVKKFHTYVDDDGLTILELTLTHIPY